MENTNPFENPPSKSEFSGYWIPSHNAKVIKEGITSNKAPFLPDANGNIKAEPVYSLSQGYCLPATRLIPVQFEKMDKGYRSNIVATRRQITDAGNSLKDGEKGVLYNFKGKDDNIHTTALFFPEQTENPQSVIDRAKEKIQPRGNLKEIDMEITSGKPVEYLGTYIAACKGGMRLSVSPEIAEEFKNNMMTHVSNDLKKSGEKNRDIDSVGNILFNADRRSTEILKTLALEQATSHSPQKAKKQEMEVCF